MIRSRVPMRRVGQPEEIAGLVSLKLLGFVNHQALLSQFWCISRQTALQRDPERVLCTCHNYMFLDFALSRLSTGSPQWQCLQ